MELWYALAPHVGRVGRADLVMRSVGCGLLIVGNVVEFWVSLLLVPTAFDAGYEGGGVARLVYGLGHIRARLPVGFAPLGLSGRPRPDGVSLK